MTYTVKQGDTLSKIAREFGTTVEALASTNGIRDKNLIKAGQVLDIPGGYPGIEKALRDCLDAIQALPEFDKLVKLLED